MRDIDKVEQVRAYISRFIQRGGNSGYYEVDLNNPADNYKVNRQIWAADETYMKKHINEPYDTPNIYLAIYEQALAPEWVRVEGIELPYFTKRERGNRYYTKQIMPSIVLPEFLVAIKIPYLGSGNSVEGLTTEAFVRSFEDRDISFNNLPVTPNMEKIISALIWERDWLWETLSDDLLSRTISGFERLFVQLDDSSNSATTHYSPFTVRETTRL